MKDQLLVAILGVVVLAMTFAKMQDQATDERARNGSDTVTAKLRAQPQSWPSSKDLIVGRLAFDHHPDESACDIHSVVLEIRNRSGHSLDVEFQPEDLKIEVLDPAGNQVNEAILPRSGPRPIAARATISPNSYWGMPTHRGGVGMPPDRILLVACLQDWILQAGTYTLRGRVTIAASHGNAVLDRLLPTRGTPRGETAFTPQGQSKPVEIVLPERRFEVAN